MKIILVFCLFFSFSFAKFSRNSYEMIVLDSNSKLVWQDNIDNVKLHLSFEKAKKYCAKLSLADFNDWRLPDIDELGTIVDKTNHYNIKPIFKFTKRAGYWSRNGLLRSFDFYGYYMNFKSGTIYYYNRLNSEYIRCVRKN